MEFADNCNDIAMETIEKYAYNNKSNTMIAANNNDMITTVENANFKSVVGESESEFVVNYKQMEIESENVQINARHGDESECTTTRNSTEVVIKQCNEEEETKEQELITQLIEDASGKGGCIVVTKQSNGMRLAFGIILRFMLPIANSVMRRFEGLRDTRFLHALKSITSSRQAVANLIAFAANTISMNLSSSQVSQRIEPVLKLFKLRKSSDGIESLPDSPSINSLSYFPTTIPPTPPSTPTTPFTPNISFPVSDGFSPFLREPSNVITTFSNAKRKTLTPPPLPAPKCCTLKIIAEPPPGQPIRADIVFIHGLHGSLTKTWKQGLWENERQPVSFERPPKPPVRPPKRPKHSRATTLPPHKEKRARFARNNTNSRYSQEEVVEHDETKDMNDDDGFFDATEQELCNGSSYYCGPAKDVLNCDGIEYSFPTFRLRLNDTGRQLQGEFKTLNENRVDVDHRDPNGGPSQPTNFNIESKGTETKLSVDDPNYSKCWPSDWLPLDCPGVRVIAINYTTDQYLWRPLWKKKEPRSSLIERAREMTELLIKHRVGYGQPIVWVGHSKGGLFIKQIIVDAWESGRPAMAPLWRSARGVFFYSVPHRGSHLACIKAPLLARSIEMLDIEKNNKYLLDLHRRFAGLYYLGHIKIEVFSFVETALTLMSVLYLRIVGVDSADPGFGDVCGIRLDHREICKPRSRDCILYQELVKMIKKVC